VEIRGAVGGVRAVAGGESGGGRVAAPGAVPLVVGYGTNDVPEDSAGRGQSTGSMRPHRVPEAIPLKRPGTGPFAIAIVGVRGQNERRLAPFRGIAFAMPQAWDP